jgi:hypothetical protein
VVRASPHRLRLNLSKIQGYKEAAKVRGRKRTQSMTELSELSQLVQEMPLCKLKNFFLQSTKSLQKSAQ